MQRVNKLFMTLVLCCFSVLFTTACEKPETGKKPDKEDVKDEKYPDKYIYSDVLFRYSDTPEAELGSDIMYRESRLAKRIPTFYAGLDAAISSGTLDSWFKTYRKEFTSEADSPEPYTVLILEALKQDKYNVPSLKDKMVADLKGLIDINLAVFEEEVQKDLANGRTGQIFDLNTVHPVRYLLESAYALRLLGQYDVTTEKIVKNFIETHIENKVNYYTGTYLTSGYNKEIFAMDVAFWVKMLYGNEYPYTNSGFEKIWNNVTVLSYDADNSPHYDSGTGFYLVLRWGLMLGREAEMTASPHLFRIMDRMAKTIMTSGMSGKWGKSMENLYSSNKELAVDGGRTMAWCLKVGYKLYGISDYLYIARKYEDLRFNSLNVSRWKASVCDLWPEWINHSMTTARPTKDFGLVHTTERIASPGYHNGTMLGRGDTDYITLQDKMMLSTGTHPDAPSLMLDMSISSSKAAQDHRIGINMSLFKSAHIASYLGRPGEPFRLNRTFVAPVTIADFPIIDIAQGDVNPTNAYTERMGYYYQTDYKIKSWKAETLSENAAYCEVEYSRFQYAGVEAKRKVVLLHNGLIAVYDQITNNSSANMNAASIYTLWPDVESQGERWALQTPHIPTTVNTPSVSEMPVLFFFPRTTSSGVMTVEVDSNRSSNENGKTKTVVFKADEPLKNGNSWECVTLIVPIKNRQNMGAFMDKVICEKVEEGYLLYIPSPEEKAIKILMDIDGKPQVS